MAGFTYDDLVAWSEEGLRPWQRDALRRLLETGPLGEGDLAELVRLAKAPNFEGDTPAPRPPSRAGVAPSGAPLPAVSVVALRDISRVNALFSGPVAFGETGLTAVYGDNGSGKSSLVRILKKACRSLAPGERIRPSIYGEAAGPPPEATIEYVAARERKAARWTEGSPRQRELETVNVFDAECARRQVERENRITYRPAILQVFTDLAAASELVKEKLEAERDALGLREADIDRLGTTLRDTEAGRFVRDLSEFSSAETLEVLATLGAEEGNELVRLRVALAENPLARADAVAARSRRLGDLQSRLKAAAALVADEASERFEAVLVSEQGAREAATAAAEAFHSDSPLEGLGSDAWKELWAAARRFSESHAYPGEAFPVTHDGSICVLCQQPLGEDGKTRLRHFDEFVRSDLQQRADKLKAEVERGTKALRELALPRSGVALGDVGLPCEGLGEELRRFLVLARARRRFLLRKSEGKAVRDRPPLPPTPDVSALKTELGAEERRLRAAAVEETRGQMLARRAELEDRETLAPKKEAVSKEMRRLVGVSRYEAAIRDCTRTGITRKEGEAAHLVLSGALRAEFAQNLGALGFTTPAVEVELGSGQQGERPYKVRLTATEDVRAAEVLSEGEKTCVALAGFLAELSTTGNRSGIVLDDPVCSLDHRFRDKVAERLALEAKARQVIVLTHDIVFLWELREHCRRNGVAVECVEVERGYREYGRAYSGAPWLGKTVKERVGWLRTALQESEAALRKQGRAAYEEKTSYVYKRMRETWERTVEELLLNRVVERFRPGVETQRLREVVDVKQDDVDRVDREMKHCSKFEHDEAAARNEGIPDPDVVRGDLERLETWVDELRRRGRRN
jgi:energy-coupling factor transporter ATP-binding protein EcfA2